MRYIIGMRTTLSIDDDILIVARDMARQEHRSVGEVVSDLARRSLRREGSPSIPGETRKGFALLPVSNPDAVVTMEMVNRLREELE